MVAVGLLLQVSASLTLPAHSAYLLEAHGAELEEGGRVRHWTDPRTSILFGGYVATTGRLTISPIVEGAGAGARYSLHVVGPRLDRTLTSIGPTPTFPPFEVAQPGWLKLTLSARGDLLGDLSGLRLEGPAVVDAKFNLKTRRNAASVHIGWPLPPTEEVEWFYNEIQAKTDPISTYYMACGFRRGYFGMQVNGPTERRVIFSIWDAGNEAVDRTKVATDNRVRLLAKGDGVVADSFGNEGTGGHSHLVYRWRTPVRQRFLVHARKDGDSTIYSGYFFLPESRKWMLIASFRAPKDGSQLRGLYSFVENFWGDNGNVLRAAEFGPAWVKPARGGWRQITTGRFTHDVTGGKDRFDYDMRPVGERFVLQNGAFEGPLLKLGTTFSVPGRATPPDVDLSHLPN